MSKEGLVIVDDSVMFLKACASKLHLAAVGSSEQASMARGNKQGPKAEVTRCVKELFLMLAV